MITDNQNLVDLGPFNNAENLTLVNMHDSSPLTVAIERNDLLCPAAFQSLVDNANVTQEKNGLQRACKTTAKLSRVLACHGSGIPMQTRHALVCHGHDPCHFHGGQDTPGHAGGGGGGGLRLHTLACHDHQAYDTDPVDNDTPGHVEWPEGPLPVSSQDTAQFLLRTKEETRKFKLSS